MKRRQNWEYIWVVLAIFILVAFHSNQSLATDQYDPECIRAEAVELEGGINGAVKMQVKRWKETNRQCGVEWIDASGKIVQRFEINKYVDLVIVDDELKHVAVVDTDAPDAEDYNKNVIPRKIADFKYFDSKGNILWKTEIGCGIGRPFWGRIELSGDGSIIGIDDGGKGAICMHPAAVESRAYDAPEWVWGVRIFSKDGKVLYKSRESGSTVISPKGKYVLVTGHDKYAEDNTYLLDMATGKKYLLPKGTCIGAEAKLSDEGAIVIEAGCSDVKGTFDPVNGFRPAENE